MKSRVAVMLVAVAMLQAVTGCSVMIPGTGMIGIGGPVIAGIIVVILVVVGVIVLAARRS